jgi:uncharacterized protein (TIGR03086 family)
MADVRSWLTDSATAFATALEGVGGDQWHCPTPNTAWDVRDLVGHVADEQLWAPPLLEGRTIDEVGDQIPVDPLGADPVAAVRDATRAMLAPLADLDLESTVHLSFGDVPAEEYLMQLFSDVFMHTWDLARATGQDEGLDPRLVEACADWFAEREDLYREAGLIGAPLPVADGDAQAQLLGRFGRNPRTDDTLATLVRFNDAFGRQDVDGIMAAMTDDCVFEDTTPPDGHRHVGAVEVRAAWAALFSANPDGVFTTEHAVISEDRATYQWTYDYGNGTVRGIDLFRVRDGRVAEKLSYVKG